MVTSEFTIGQVAEQAGVSEATLRRWEREGKLRPERTPLGYRVYSWQDVEQIDQLILQKQERLST